MKRIFAVFVMLLAFIATGAESVKALKILTIGNSFAWSVFDSLKKITAADPGCKVTIVAANMSGSPLERHWKYWSFGNFCG